MRVIAVSGVKNSGKTTLIERLLPCLNAAGLKVAVIKHDGHRFAAEPDTVDTGRAWTAGAYGTAVFDGEKFLLAKRERTDEQALIKFFPEADLILLEGFKSSDWPKLEVVRAGNSEAPVCDPQTLLALVTDLPIKLPDVPTFGFGLNEIQEIAALLIRYARPKFAGVILAGGLSSRMGLPKAELLLGERTFLEWQLEKLQSLGLRELVVSGMAGFNFNFNASPDIKLVSDRYPERGPLGGLHASLSEITAPCALVVPVDMPLIPVQTLAALLDAHRKNEAEVTALTIDGKVQPLIAVYNAGLASSIEPLIRGRGRSVWALLDRCRVETVAYTGPRCRVQNCNTPEEYNALLAVLETGD